MGDPDLAKQLVARVGQCVLTCAGTACFSGLAGDGTAAMGRSLRYFGDGFQSSKRIGGRRYWRVPVMDGEFLVEDAAGVQGGVGGGNFLILCTTGEIARAAVAGRDRRDAPAAQRDHALPRRRGALGLEGRLALQGPDRLDQRRLLPDHPRRRRPGRHCRTRWARCSRSSSTG